MNIPTSLLPQPPTIFDIFWADISPPNSKMENNLWLSEGVIIDDPRKACRNNKLHVRLAVFECGFFEFYQTSSSYRKC